MPDIHIFKYVCEEKEEKVDHATNIIRETLVAMTRPRRSLTIIGDSETVSR